MAGRNFLLGRARRAAAYDRHSEGSMLQDTVDEMVDLVSGGPVYQDAMIPDAHDLESADRQVPGFFPEDPAETAYPSEQAFEPEFDAASFIDEDDMQYVQGPDGELVPVGYVDPTTIDPQAVEPGAFDTSLEMEEIARQNSAFAAQDAPHALSSAHPQADIAESRAYEAEAFAINQGSGSLGQGPEASWSPASSENVAPSFEPDSGEPYSGEVEDKLEPPTDMYGSAIDPFDGIELDLRADDPLVAPEAVATNIEARAHVPAAVVAPTQAVATPHVAAEIEDLDFDTPNHVDRFEAAIASSNGEATLGADAVSPQVDGFEFDRALLERSVAGDAHEIDQSGTNMQSTLSADKSGNLPSLDDIDTTQDHAAVAFMQAQSPSASKRATDLTSSEAPKKMGMHRKLWQGSGPSNRSSKPQSSKPQNKLFAVAAGMAAVVLVGIVGLAGTKLLGGGSSGAGSAPRLILASTSDLKGPAPEQPVEEDTSAKLIYDRAGADTDPVPQTIVDSSEQPVAELPIVRDIEIGQGGEAAPRRVRTVIVRPDGTIVETTTEPSTASAAVETSLVDQTTNQVPNQSDLSGTEVSTQQNAASESAPAATPEPAVAATATQQSTTVVAAEEVTVIPEPAPRPAQAVDSVPAATVQAQAPARVTQPAATTAQSTTGGPVDLLNQPAATAGSQPTTTASIPSGGFIVQVSSQRSEDQARAAFSSFQQRLGGVIGQQQPVIQRADLGDRGIFYRVGMGPMAQADANTLCNRIKSAGSDCFVRAN